MKHTCCFPRATAVFAEWNKLTADCLGLSAICRYVLQFAEVVVELKFRLQLPLKMQRNFYKHLFTVVCPQRSTLQPSSHLPTPEMYNGESTQLLGRRGTRTELTCQPLKAQPHYTTHAPRSPTFNPRLPITLVLHTLHTHPQRPHFPLFFSIRTIFWVHGRSSIKILECISYGFWFYVTVYGKHLHHYD